MVFKIFRFDIIFDKWSFTAVRVEFIILFRIKTKIHTSTPSKLLVLPPKIFSKGENINPCFRNPNQEICLTPIKSFKTPPKKAMGIANHLKNTKMNLSSKKSPRVQLSRAVSITNHLKNPGQEIFLQNSKKYPKKAPNRAVNITNHIRNPNQEVCLSSKKTPNIVFMILNEKQPDTCDVTFVKNYAYSTMQIQGFNPLNPPLYSGDVGKYYQNNWSQIVLSEFAQNSSKFKDTVGTILEWPGSIHFTFKNEDEAKKCLKMLFPNSKDAENKMKIHVHIMPNCNDMWNEEIRHFIYNIEKKSSKKLSDYVPFNLIYA